MKRSFALIIAAMLLLTVCAAGCSKKTDTPENDKKAETTEKKDTEKKDAENKDGKAPSNDDLKKATDAAADALKKADDAGLLVSADKKKWPAEILPPGLPEYSKGKLFAWNGSEKECLIMIHDTNKNELDEYLKLLKSEGWNESNEQYKKPPYYICFQFNADTALQITVYKDDVLVWPKDRIPDVPPLTAGTLTQVYFDKDYPDALQLYVEGLSEDKIMEYEKVLLSEGFNKDDDKYYSKTGSTLNGKEYSKISMWFDSNGPDEWMINLSGE